LLAYLVRKLRDLEVRLNRPLLPRESEAGFIADWQAGEVLQRLEQLQPSLLVSITTYRRPGEAAALIASLAQALGEARHSVFVCVFNDRAPQLDEAKPARQALQHHFGERGAWLDARRHLGKQLFWRTHQMIFIAARRAGAAQLLSLQDDVSLVPDFMARLRQVWQRSGEQLPERRVLNLFAGDDDEPDGRWIRRMRMTLPGTGARRTDWFDLAAFMIDRQGLALLRDWVVPVPPGRWRKDPTLSSGVGRQFTLRLFNRAAVVQCEPPLVLHGAAESRMNPQARLLRPMDNRARAADARGAGEAKP
jgi:hypothetical protein